MCVRGNAHNIAQNRPDNFPSYPPDNHHCSDDVYLREEGRTPEAMKGTAFMQPEAMKGTAFMQPEAMKGTAFMQPEALKGTAFMQPV